jgi:hypothetical protein
MCVISMSSNVTAVHVVHLTRKCQCCFIFRILIDIVIQGRSVIQWLRSALSKVPNSVGIFPPHLRTEADSVSETLCFLVAKFYRTTLYLPLCFPVRSIDQRDGLWNHGLDLAALTYMSSGSCHGIEMSKMKFGSEAAMSTTPSVDGA